MTATKRRTLAVVDGNSLLHRAFHALPPTMTAPDGRPTNAVFGFISMLVKLVQELSPDAVVVAFDRGKPAFRTQALEQYKIHRPPTAEELKSQFPMVKDMLGALAVPVVEVEGWEGDDVLGTLAERASREDMRVLLVTGDRDALQLVDDNVSVVTTRKGITDITVYDAEAVFERYGVTPAQVPDYLGLKGDTSDNIPGVPGVGEKTAAKLIAAYRTLEEVLAHAHEQSGKLRENLTAHADAALASRTVATIRCDVPVDLDIANVRWGSWDPREVAEAFGELRFTSLLDRILSTAGGGGSDVEAPQRPREVWEVESGAAAVGWLEAQLAGDGEMAFGAAFDDGSTTSLFADKLEVALAREGTVAVLAGTVAVQAVGNVLGTGVLAAGDTKALLTAVCAEESAEGSCVLDNLDPLRLFDCGVAAYLLESSRSSYELRGLSADYLGEVPAEPGEDGPSCVAEARMAARLTPVLRERLEEDGSMDCFRRIEMPLVPVLLRMESAGVGIDSAALGALADEIRGRVGVLMREIHQLAGVEFNVDSPKQLGEILFEKLGLPAGKRTKTGFSTDASVLGGLAPAFPIAGKVLEYRELTKLMSTYIEALPRLVGADGRLHTTFNQTVAATGRLSSSSPNLQNIPIRTELGRRIRAAFVPARAGDVIVSADYSQIELRILAHLSEDPGLIEAFTSGTDFHAATASRVFGVDMGSVTAEHRRRAKAVNFGIVYGISSHGLAESLGVPRAEAQTMIDRYFAAYPGVREFLDRTVAEAYRDGWATTLFSRRRRIPELKAASHQVRSFGERTAMNHPMQGTAADIMKLAMIEVDKRLGGAGFEARMVMQVHDELVFESPAPETERLSEMARGVMSGVTELSVPLVVDVAFGPNWASSK